jgi:transcriptional regulator
MYLRAAHAEFDVTQLRKFIRDNPLGIIITAIPSSNYSTIQCSHVPWILDVSDENSSTELGRLRGHMAKANSHSKVMSEVAEKDSNGYLEQEILVLFNGPVHAYVTPKFYTETKPTTGKVVPTWNYSAVQVYGKAKIYFDSKSPETGSFLQKQLRELSQHSEEHVMGYTGGERPSAWEVEDAPETYVALLQKSIIGVEIEIERMEGKWKMSQEIGKGDREGVVKGFEALKTEEGEKIARTVEERGKMKDDKAAAAKAA